MVIAGRQMMASLTEIVRRTMRRLTGSRVAVAAAWSTAALIVGNVARIGGNLVMTRLLAPEMFGVMSIVAVVQISLGLFSDIGVRTVVISSAKGDDPRLLDTAWTLEILRGAGIWLVGLVLAAALSIAGHTGFLPAGSAWAAPELPLVLAAASLSALISGLQSTRLMTASRHMDARTVSIIEVAAQLGGLLAMISLGLLTRSIWSLVAGGLVSTLIVTLASHVCLPGHRNRPAWDRDALREFYRQGRWVLASSIVFVLANSTDRFLLAGYLDAAHLGFYAIALALIQVVDTIGGRFYSSVALPRLSEAARAGDGQLRATLLRLRLPLDLAYLWTAGLIYATGPTIVAILYDARYQAAGSMLQMLSFGLVFSRYGILCMAYVAMGRPDVMAKYNVIRLIAILALLTGMFHVHGTQGAILAVALHGAAALAYLLWQNRSHGLNDFRHETIVLAAWPVGLACGLIGLRVLSLLTGYAG